MAQDCGEWKKIVDALTVPHRGDTGIDRLVCLKHHNTGSILATKSEAKARNFDIAF